MDHKHILRVLLDLAGQANPEHLSDPETLQGKYELSQEAAEAIAGKDLDKLHNLLQTGQFALIDQANKQQIYVVSGQEDLLQQEESFQFSSSSVKVTNKATGKDRTGKIQGSISFANDND